MIKAPVKNTYELLLILKPNLREEELENNISKVESAIKNYGGNILRVDKPYRNRFTHKIKSFKDGFYVPILFSSTPDAPNILKRTLSISDDVLRYMIVRGELGENTK
ncbi:MAG: 30S ribosomal protein S6 [Candidatus Melainabacteria bacterium]|nr:30S ribosomal protein S6 [Candidatus Melainabacteria bacterium]